MKLTIQEYSKLFKMSKEMIHSKIRSKQLNVVRDGSSIFIIVPREVVETKQHIPPSQEKEEVKRNTPPPTRQKTTVAMVLNLYQKENQQLKNKIVELEAKIDKLIDDKEQMLRDEMQKIEKLYNTKDEQLKSIIELISTKLINEQKQQTIHEVEALENTQRDEPIEKEEIVELKEYLKTLDLEPYQKKVIKKRFLAAYGSDIRVIKQNGKIYLNFSKYDYSDLLEY